MCLKNFGIVPYTASHFCILHALGLPILFKAQEQYLKDFKIVFLTQCYTADTRISINARVFIQNIIKEQILRMRILIDQQLL